MEPQPSPDLKLFQCLIPLAMNLRFAWFIGHLCHILFVLEYASLWTLIQYNSIIARFCYRTAFISAAATYGIAVYKILCFRARTSQKIQGGALSIATYETVQYFALALVWLVMPQWSIALLPYWVYSIFHVAVYTRSDLIPTLKTNIVPAFQARLQANTNLILQTTLQANPNLALEPKQQTIVDRATSTLDPEMVPVSDTIADKISGSQWIHPILLLATRITVLSIGTLSASISDSIADNIRVFIKKYYDISMSAVSTLEVFIWIRLLFSAITFQRWSWIMIVFYTVFLRARYDQNTHTRIAFAQLDARVHGFLDAQNISPIARLAWKIARALTLQFYHVSDLNKYMGGDSTHEKTT